jgi:heme oxygenase
MRKELRKNYRRFYIDFKNADWLKILLRAREANMKSTTFIKHMALNGKLIVYDTKPMNNLALSINRIGNNINQIVHLANEVHSLNMDDIERLEKLLMNVKDEVWEDMHYTVYERKEY